MASIVGAYRLNFTDPNKGSFVIDPYTSNGTITPTSNVLHARSARANTSLLWIGQYVPNYGERIQENMLHMLENFSGQIDPVNPITGQLWHDTGRHFTIIGLHANGIIVEGNQSSVFSNFMADNTELTIQYGPVSATDNSFITVQVVISEMNVVSATSEYPAGTTRLSLTAPGGSPVTIPAAAVGGSIVEHALGTGRLRMAAEVNGEMKWIDTVHIPSQATPPLTNTVINGNPWFNPSSGTLHVYHDGDWVNVAGNYLSLTGGTMTGHLNMSYGAQIKTSNAPVDTDDVPNSGWVSTQIAQSIQSAQSGMTNDISDLQDGVTAISDTLPSFIVRTGDNFTGTLTFGPSSGSVITTGIDMYSFPIINTTNVWDPTDYLNANFFSNYVIDKQYVANALAKHLQDVNHVERGYLLEQPDGKGLIPGEIFFNDSNRLFWSMNSTSYNMMVEGNALVLQTGSNANDVLELRHGSQPAGFVNPAFQVTDTDLAAFQTMYLLDGSPQPEELGGVNDRNADTRVATRGYVKQSLAEATTGYTPVLDATFSYNAAADLYTLTLDRGASVSAIPVDLYHTHGASTLTYTYTDPGNNGGSTGADPILQYLTDLGYTVPAVPVPLHSMLTALNFRKAPIRDALFETLPECGLTLSVIGVDAVLNGLEIVDVPASLVEGMTLNLIIPISAEETESTPYRVIGFETVEVVDPEDPLDTDIMNYVIVEPTLPVFDPLIDVWNVELGDTSGTDKIRALPTMASVDYLLHPVAKRAYNRQVDIAGATTVTKLDGFNWYKSTASTAFSITIEADIPWDSERPLSFDVCQFGTGAVTIIGDAGVTVVGLNGTVTSGQYAVIKVRQVGLNQYIVTGDATV